MFDIMDPIIVYPAVYALRLEDDCYYIGISYNLNIRWSQHWNGTGAKWTRLHKPIEVIRVIYPAVEHDIENRITREYIELYGSDKVRGGNHCKC